MVPAIEEMGSYLTQQSRCIVFSAREATNRWETERLQEKATFALNRRAYHVFVFFVMKKGSKGLPRRRHLSLGDDDDGDGRCLLAFTMCLDRSERFSKAGVWSM